MRYYLVSLNRQLPVSDRDRWPTPTRAERCVNRREISVRFFCILLCLLLSACAANRVPIYTANYSEVSSGRIAKGDKIKVTTFGEDRFSGEYLVHGNGKISFPLFGDIPAEGLTAAELGAAIAGQLAPDYLRDPQVVAEVISFRPVYVLGEVARPGQYAYVEGMTMFALFAQAGGLSYRANHKNVYIRHDGQRNEIRLAVESSTPVRPGDTIRVTQRIF